MLFVLFDMNTGLWIADPVKPEALAFDSHWEAKAYIKREGLLGIGIFELREIVK